MQRTLLTALVLSISIAPTAAFASSTPPPPRTRAHTVHDRSPRPHDRSPRPHQPA